MSSRDVKTVSVRTAVGLVVGTAAVFFTGVYAARATPGGATKNALSFAGTLTGVDASQPQTLIFDFKKGGASVCMTPKPPEVAGVMVDPVTRGFRVEIPLDSCPATLFDGGDVTLEISVAGVVGVLATGPVNPVPYAKYADYAAAVNPNPDCPAGYTKTGLAAPFLLQSTLCVKGADEVVKVGTGASAFWIDRHEASVWTTADGPPNAAQKFGIGDDSTINFPKNGQILAPLYALSVAGVPPSGRLTWFQANEACSASGKRLPHGDEWLKAARGTNDPGANTGTNVGNAKCHTQGNTSRQTGAGLGATQPTSCVSDWGAQDMIGDLWEWTADWHAGVGDTAGSYSNWPAEYGDDLTANIVSSAVYPPTGKMFGIPVAAFRGGSFNDMTGAGTFALHLNHAPSSYAAPIGFRCLLPR
ncbi:MAG: SUMF1/EgtB/PvdO family nonheme iron enzyme [Minicystis sp.]